MHLILEPVFPALYLVLIMAAILFGGFSLVKFQANLPLAPGKGLVPLLNVSEGTHAGALTRKGGAIISTPYRFVKKGTGDMDVILCSTVGEAPLGIITDEAPAIGELVNMNLLGSASNTQLVEPGGDIDIGDWVITDDAGKAIALPTSGGGTAYICGRALTAGADGGDPIEIDPVLPYPVTIAA